ncbi:MAG: non-hydrolyzing UDP-N-acetylglucosamine 2-epimerase [Thermoplasmata archaeon]
MISIVVGTRPEIIKMAPIILELQRRSMDFRIVHTGQHYDLELSEVFFEELGLPRADDFLEVGSGTQAYQTAMSLMKLEEVFIEEKPHLVLVEGDTNTVLAGALAGAKLGIDVGHVEAGLRSHDLRMPEEHNRRLTDHLSKLLFAPTEWSATNLRKEGVWGEVFVTGNTVIDACLRYVPLALKKSRIMDEVEFEEFALVTAHRAENVDDPLGLKNLVQIFVKCPVPVVYPLHPRTTKRLKEQSLWGELSESENVQIIPPVGYFDFLVLMRNCRLILTDSGGIQEEATAPNIRKKVFVLRSSTERPEAVEAGYAEVVGLDSTKVLQSVEALPGKEEEFKEESPYGSGDSGKRIVDILGSSS